MPKTMYHYLRILLDAHSVRQNVMDANELLKIQLRLLENLRHNDYYRSWVLKSTLKLLEYLDKPNVGPVDKDLRMKLWILVNRALHSQVETKRVPESILSLAFQIYLKLLPTGELVTDVRIHLNK